MKPREKQFISLKKAAEISGYSPDYIGYLIRKGKIKGKKIFANISWQTTPEEVIKYCKRTKNLDIEGFSFIKKKKYISLKEAAKISDYTSDYIGYLIRTGKIKGRKIYSGISWMTTEEAIKKYQEAKTQIQKEIPFNLSPYLNLIIPQRGNKLFGFGWRLGLAAFVIFFLVSGFAPVKFFQASIAAITGEETKTVNLYTNFSSGDWENSQNIQGPPEAGPLGTIDSFSETNSAIYKSGSQSIVCDKFDNSNINGDLSNYNFQSAKIKFSFAIGEKIPDFDLPPSPPPTTTPTTTTPTTTTTTPATTTISVDLTADPNLAEAPLNDIDLIVNVSGTATGTITYYFNCGSSENWDMIATTTEENYIASDLCNFEEPNTYEAEVKVERGELEAETTTTIEVSEPNHPPQAFDQNITLNENTSTTITLNATDTDGNSLSYSILSEPENGTLVADNLPEVTYSPNENYYGEDSFTFKVSDGKAESNEATVKITIEQVNPPEQVSGTSTTSTNAELPIEDLNNTATDTSSGTNDQSATSTDSSFFLERPTHFSLWGKVKNFFGTLVVKTKKVLAYLRFNLKQLIDVVFIVKAEEGTSTTATSTTETLPNLDDKIIIWYSLDGENWQILDTISDYPLSNALNGGYFEYNASFLENWDDAKNLKVKFEGVVGGETNVTAYLDSIWVEVTYKEQAIEEEQPQEEPQEQPQEEPQEQPQEQPTEELPESEEAPSEETPEETTEETSEEIEEPTEEEFEEEEIEEEEEEEEPEEEQEEESVEDSFLQLLSERDDFQLNEEPRFRFRYKKIITYVATVISTPTTSIVFPDWGNINIKTKLRNPKGEISDTLSDFSFENNGEFSFKLEKPRAFKPGLYKLIFTIEENGQTQEFERTFTWGVLAINVNKSIYLPNEQAYIQMAALRDDGHTICDANLKLEIISPQGNITHPEVQKSGKCGPDNVTNVADYFAYYQVDGPGIYQMKLINLDNGYEIEDSFEVREWVPFDIERIGPTRIYPPAIYEMRIKIKVNQDFVGQVVERVPLGFRIENIECRQNDEPLNSNSYILNSSDPQEIIWQVAWKAGEEYELKYQFDAQDVSPYLYLLGPLRFEQ